MKKNLDFLSKFLGEDEPVTQDNIPARSIPRDGVRLVDARESIFDSLNRHMAELIDEEARAKAAHAEAVEAIATFEIELKAQFTNQIAAIEALFSGVKKDV